jgi:hypothetical protein
MSILGQFRDLLNEQAQNPAWIIRQKACSYNFTAIAKEEKDIKERSEMLEKNCLQPTVLHHGLAKR